MGGLRACRSAQSRLQTWAFKPPLGSRLVTEVMNSLKSQYRFIDLLKPENEAVIPILAAIEPGCIRALLNITALATKKAMTETKSGRPPRHESRIAQQPTSTPRVPMEQEMADDALTAAAHAVAQNQLAQAQALLRELQPRPTQAEAAIGDGLLASLSSAYSLIRMLKHHEQLPQRLQHLRDALVSHRQSIGSTFALESGDPVYLNAAKTLTENISGVVIFGHSHLPKCIPMEHGALYLNTGTWCPTIRLPASLYQPGTDNDVLADFVADMQHNHLEPWTTLQTCCARVELDGDVLMHAGLCEVLDDLTLQPIGQHQAGMNA